MPRLQLDLSETSMELVEKLRELCDLGTKKDVVENALMVLSWAATEASKGLTIAAVDEQHNKYREIFTPALEGAKAKARRQEEGRHRKALSA